MARCAMMNILFIHQNMPGQFRHLIAALATAGLHRVVCIGKRPDFAQPGVGRISYEVAAPAAAAHPFLETTEAAVRHGQQVAQICAGLGANGFRPDVVVAHPGWGESLYVKEVFPQTPLLHYCEFYYHSHGADANFDPAQQQTLDGNCRTRTLNAHLLLALEACDWGVCPTHWQKRQHPAEFQARLSVIFDGIDTDRARPDPAARFTLPDGSVLAAGDEVLTYVARTLEPYRGFPSFARALPELLRRRPALQVVVLGGDEVSYGLKSPGGGAWRAALQAELNLDPARVHFLGRIPYADYLRLLQVAAVHVYLTVPFVLSWSMLEAMACGALVIGSATPPVQEVIADGRNGLLVDFFDPAMIAARVTEALEQRDRLAPLRAAARETVLRDYSLARCLPRQLALIDTLAAGRLPV
jgi:glycosyltransferase involved in cell wall biosynthesis